MHKTDLRQSRQKPRDQPKEAGFAVTQKRRPVFAGDEVEITTVPTFGRYGESTGQNAKGSAKRYKIVSVYADAKQTVVKTTSGDVWGVYWDSKTHVWRPARNQERLI